MRRPAITEMFTENGALSLASSGDARLNLFFKATRDVAKWGRDNDALFRLIDESWAVNPYHTMKILMNWRDCRGGKGDHAGFIIAMSHIEKFYHPWFEANLDIIPHFGSYLDIVKLWHLVSDEGKSKIMKFIVATLEKDKRESRPSLLTKWIPSEGAKWDRGFISALCKSLFHTSTVTSYHLRKLRKEYIALLRSRLNLLETKLCNKDYDSITYEHVPSVAMHKYKKAFLRNDQEDFAAFIQRVKTGQSSIHASQISPHLLVKYYFDNSNLDEVVEAQWNAIKTKVREQHLFDNSICVCDVSGSMDGTPMHVAIALGLLCSNNNKLITFSEHPQLFHVYDGTLKEQVHLVRQMPWGSNTNFERVMDLVLGMSASQKIEKVYVFSDMQFDMAFGRNTSTHFKMVRNRFKIAGIDMPQIVFWNLRGNTCDFPVCQDDTNVIMLSGYSPALLSSILSGEKVTPLTVLMNILDSPRYDVVRKVL